MLRKYILALKFDALTFFELRTYILLGVVQFAMCGCFEGIMLETRLLQTRVFPAGSNGCLPLLYYGVLPLLYYGVALTGVPSRHRLGHS